MIADLFTATQPSGVWSLLFVEMVLLTTIVFSVVCGCTYLAICWATGTTPLWRPTLDETREGHRP